MVTAIETLKNWRASTHKASIDGPAPESFAGLVSAIELHFELLTSLIHSLKDQHERELAQYEPEREQQPEPEEFSCKAEELSVERPYAPLPRTSSGHDGDSPEKLHRTSNGHDGGSPGQTHKNSRPSSCHDGDRPGLPQRSVANLRSGVPTPRLEEVIRPDDDDLQRQSARDPSSPSSRLSTMSGASKGGKRSSVSFASTSPVVVHTTSTEKKSIALSKLSSSGTCSFALGDAINHNPLLKAIKKGNTLEVQSLLDDSADPNQDFGHFNMGLEFQSGGPLAVAVMKGHTHIVLQLTDAKANINADYSFLAGAEQKIWSGTAIHATVPGGNLDMMKLLVELRANVRARGSNNATLLWQAAYFGKPEMCSYLLENRIHTEQRAISQDDESLSYTPLHIASLQGNAGVVKVLLKAKASVQVDNASAEEMGPLDDAVLQGHTAVVELLVAGGSDLFHATLSRAAPAGRRSLRRVSLRTSVRSDGSAPTPPQRCIDKVFYSKNPLLLAAVAKGLKDAGPKLLDGITSKDLTEFLNCRGESPMLILEAIFRPYTLSYWELTGGKRKRMVAKAAHIAAAQGMNTVEGPHFQGVFFKAFQKKECVNSDLLEFLHSLAPQEPLPHKVSFYSPATFFMCHIPLVHRSLNVLVALADCANRNIFHEPGCEAIVNLVWSSSWRGSYAMIVFCMVELTLLEVITFSLAKPTSEWLGWAMMPASVAALLVWTLHVVVEVARAVGYISCGLLRRYLSAWDQCVENATLSMAGAVIVPLLVFGPGLKANRNFSIVLGMVTFTSWMRVLSSLKAIEAVGLRILPITTTMLQSGPFCFVLLVYLLGSTSMYFSLGLNTFEECFLVIYRLVVLADLDLFEMEAIWAPTLTLPASKDIDGGSIELGTPNATTNYWPVRLIMLIFSFAIGVLIMNLFIAILCQSYCEACDASHEAFMRCRVCKVLDHKAVVDGLQILSCRRRRGVASSDSLSAQALAEEEGEEEGVVDPQHCFIWYCRPKDVQ